MSVFEQLEALSPLLETTPEKAVPALQSLSQSYPKQPEVWFSLGNACSLAKNFGAAKKAYLKACALAPHWYPPFFNLGLLYYEHHEPKKASARFRKAISLNPGFAMGHTTLSTLYKESCQLKKALYHAKKAVELDPENVTIRTNFSYLLLTRGLYDKGWNFYESRFQTNHMLYYPKLSRPRWNGILAPGLRILVHFEQGLGDTLQFCRLLRHLAAQNVSVLFRPHGSLFSLMTSSFSDLPIQILRDIPAPETFDVHVPLMSLPYLMGITMTKNPVQMPYLKCEPRYGDKFLPYFSGVKKIKVGLVWHQGIYDVRHFKTNRSFPLKKYVDFLARPEIQFYGFQKTVSDEEVSPYVSNGSLINLGPLFSDFSDTAGAASHLDLLISIDTSVLHLSGGMGIPTWVLAHKPACWRWLLRRKKCPWYPSVTLFRQKKPLEWDPLLREVATSLDRFIASLSQPD